MRSSRTPRRAALLKTMVERLRAYGEGRKYDCILGLSGVDSSYLAWLAVKLGLGPLLVHFDNGWNSELAVANIEQICRKLNLPLQTFVMDWPEFRDIALRSSRRPFSISDPDRSHDLRRSTRSST